MQVISRQFRYADSFPSLSFRGRPFSVLEPDKGECKLLTPKATPLPGGGCRMYFASCGDDGCCSIASACSDDGKTWRREPGMRLVPPLELGITRLLGPEPFVLEDGSLRMYLEATLETGRSVVMSALSGDGLDWAFETDRRIDDGTNEFGSPCCLPGPEGGVRLYYHQYESVHHDLPATRNIVSAVSDDGLAFTPEPGTRIAQEAPEETYCVYGADIHQYGGQWHMLYSAWASAGAGMIKHACSRDGLAWVKTSDPVLEPRDWPPVTVVSEPSLVILGETAFLYCETRFPDGSWRILGASNPIQ